MFLNRLFKFVLITAIFMGIAIYGNYLTSGKLPPYLQPLADFSRTSTDLITNIKDKTQDVLSQSKPVLSPDYIYKWTDASGQIHLTSTQPDAGIAFERVKLQGNTNIVPAISVSDQSAEQNAITSDEISTSTPVEPGLGDVYSPEKIEQLYRDAETIRDDLNQRVENQADLLSE